MTWQEQLKAELEAMPPAERFVAAGRWSTELTRVWQPYLATERRLAILAALNRSEGRDPAWFADLVGSEPGTIERLAQEGRSILRRNSAA